MTPNTACGSLESNKGGVWNLPGVHFQVPAVGFARNMENSVLCFGPSPNMDSSHTRIHEETGGNSSHFGSFFQIFNLAGPSYSPTSMGSRAVCQEHLPGVDLI